MTEKKDYSSLVETETLLSDVLSVIDHLPDLLRDLLTCMNPSLVEYQEELKYYRDFYKGEIKSMDDGPRFAVLRPKIDAENWKITANRVSKIQRRIDLFLKSVLAKYTNFTIHLNKLSLIGWLCSRFRSL